MQSILHRAIENRQPQRAEMRLIELPQEQIGSNDIDHIDSKRWNDKL